MEGKTPREFRNALYLHLIDHDVTDATASTIVAEAEMYVEAYLAFQLRGIEFGAKQMGFKMPPKKEASNV